MTRILTLLAGLLMLAACAAQNPIASEPKLALGDFQLGHNIVVAPKIQKGPVSRDATKEEWIASLTGALDDRFRRYEGDALYHFGISIEGYMLAPVGIPVAYKPKSALILFLTVWDDKAGRKYNDKPHQMVIFESSDAESFVVGSGATRDRLEQMNGLSYNASKEIEKWLAVQHKRYGWFTANPVYNPPDSVPTTAQK